MKFFKPGSAAPRPPMVVSQVLQATNVHTSGEFESISKFPIANRFHVTLRIFSLTTRAGLRGGQRGQLSRPPSARGHPVMKFICLK